jgi:hypothetical protein
MKRRMINKQRVVHSQREIGGIDRYVLETVRGDRKYTKIITISEYIRKFDGEPEKFEAWWIEELEKHYDG